MHVPIHTHTFMRTHIDKYIHTCDRTYINTHIYRSELFLEGASEDDKKAWISILNKTIKGQSFALDEAKEKCETCNPFYYCF